MTNMSPKLYDRCLHRPPLMKTGLINNIKDLMDQTETLSKLAEEEYRETREEEAQTSSDTSEVDDVQKQVINLVI